MTRNAGASEVHVPPPVPPGDPAAWYADRVVAQYTIRPGVVATIRRTDDANGERQTDAGQSAGVGAPTDAGPPTGTVPTDADQPRDGRHDPQQPATTGDRTPDDQPTVGDSTAREPAASAPFSYETREPTLGPTGRAAYE
ncbi:MAG: hypothetical protein ABEI99_07890, partial [Halobaculum sp.]